MGRYKIYHIPGKKIGCTIDIQKRVVEQQGYKPGEYEILLQTDSIEEASNAERILQKELGYKIDRQLYKNLFKKAKNMKYSSSEYTTTFKVSPKDIDAHFLQDLKIKTNYGTYELDTEDKIDWILANINASQFGPSTCYVYNKAIAEAEVFKEKPTRGFVNDIQVFTDIRKWAYDRGIYDKGDPKTQLIKLYEEAGELAQATLKQDTDGIIDAIGDCIVVLTNLAHLNALRIEDCIDAAYTEISGRTGKMSNGTFVKD